MELHVTNLKKYLGSTTVQNVSLYLKQLSIRQFMEGFLLNNQEIKDFRFPLIIFR